MNSGLSPRLREIHLALEKVRTVGDFRRPPPGLQYRTRFPVACFQQLMIFRIYWPEASNFLSSPEAEAELPYELLDYETPDRFLR